MEININSYPSIYNLGHKQISNIFEGEVVVEEKVDGSQFSFMRVGEDIFCRSKGVQIDIDNPNKMFSKAVETVKEIYMLLHDGWVYRGEFLQRPKHNTLAYDRTPEKFIILFDVMIAEQDFLNPEHKTREAKRLGLEAVPLVHQGKVKSIEQVKGFLDRKSILGDVNIEGVVIKNYNQFTRSKKIALAKFVSDDFREKHTKDWKDRNPNRKDVIARIIKEYRHENRFKKAIQHLRDDGALTETPRDIGALMKEINADILKEEKEAIKEELFRHFWKDISRGITRGFPEWYKEQLSE